MSYPETEQDSWFRQHVAPHESMLRGHLQSAFPTLADVDDIVQESYFRLIQAKKTGTIRYAKAFLFATARNIAIDLIRHRRVVPIQAVTEIDGLSVIGEDTGLIEAVNRQEELAFLADAIRALPERCRQEADLMLRYRWRLPFSGGARTVVLQCNITNLFDESGIIPKHLSSTSDFVVPGGRGIGYSRFDLVDPRAFRFTASYEF